MNRHALKVSKQAVFAEHFLDAADRLTRARFVLDQGEADWVAAVSPTLTKAAKRQVYNLTRR